MADDVKKVADEESHLWTDEQGIEIERILIEKWGREKKCNMCGEPRLRIGPSPAMIVNMTADGQRTLLNGGYPSIVVVCQNCGNTLILNGIVLGLFTARGEQEVAHG